MIENLKSLLGPPNKEYRAGDKQVAVWNSVHKDQKPQIARASEVAVCTDTSQHLMDVTASELV